MHTETRKKKIRMMCALWSIIPVAFCIYALVSDSPNGIVALIAVMCICGLLMLMGVFVYLGYTGLLAGFNTMTPDELNRYDMEKVSEFMGLSIIVSTFIAFFSAVAVLMITDNAATASITSILILTVVILFSAFYVGFGERFKA